MTRTYEEIRDWLVERISSLTGLSADEVDPHAPLSRHGLDSVVLITLAADLEKWSGYRFRENPLEQHPTIDALARFLADQSAQRPEKP